MWDLDALASSGAVATASLQIVARVETASTLSNTATSTRVEQTDPNPANDSSTVTFTGEVGADLAITKTTDTPVVIPGTPVTYTIAVTNGGPSAVTGATVTDTVPATLIDVTWICTASGDSACPASGTGDIDTTVDLAVGGVATFTLTGTVASGATVPLANTASVTLPPEGRDPTPDNNSATATETLAPQADLGLTKSDGETSAVPGTPLTYTLVVTNQGPSAVTGATVTDPVPAALTGVTWTCTASTGSQCPASGSGTLNAAVDLLVDGTATFALTGTVAPEARGSLTNTAMVAEPPGATDPVPTNDSATDTDTLEPQADLMLTKTDGSSSAVPGQTVTYTIVVTNLGPSTVTNAMVSDILPAPLTGASWTCTPIARCGASTGTGNIDTTVSLPVNGTATFTVTGMVRATATGTLANTASITPPAGTTDPALGNNSVTDTDALTPQADLRVTKTDGARRACYRRG